MKIIAAVDDNNGMMFNKRRQSQDRILREHILSLSQETRLWMSPYSLKQFSKEMEENWEDRIRTRDDFLNSAGEGDYCFVEDADLLPYLEQIEEIILFKWNRVYPADTYFPIDYASWKLMKTEEFAGSSHEKITKEVYIYE